MGAEKTLYQVLRGKAPQTLVRDVFFLLLLLFFFFFNIFLIKKRIETPSCVLNQNGGDLDVCVGYVCSMTSKDVVYTHSLWSVYYVERTVASISP